MPGERRMELSEEELLAVYDLLPRGGRVAQGILSRIDRLFSATPVEAGPTAATPLLGPLHGVSGRLAGRLADVDPFAGSDPGLVERARSEVAHGCDGPLTPYVLVARAVREASRNRLPPDALIEALWLELSERGWISEDGLEETGS